MNRRSVATRYPALVVVLLVGTLVAAGAVETWLSHRDRLAALETLQREHARFAAASVSRFVDDVLRSLAWVTLAPLPADDLEARRTDFHKLLKLEPSITTITLADRDGRERLRVSRIETNRVASGVDLSRERGFATARAGRTHFGDVHFVLQTEPYLRIATPAAPADGSVLFADVNLKFVRSVVSGIRVGQSGHAYVVDAGGRLVSHPDLALVLRMTDLASHPQVVQASASGASGFTDAALGPTRAASLAAWARIEPLNWTVFVEQPRSEAFAPLVASATRSLLIVAAALALAAFVGIVSARRMVRPLEELRRGAQRLGAGELSHRIEVVSGDELQELASQFNTMAGRLQQIYADLEQRVRQRTQDLDRRNDELAEASRRLALADQAKSRLLAAASHDLRQPMHALSLFVGQLRSSRSAIERKLLTDRIESAVSGLGELLDQLLDLSRLEAGAVQPERESFPVGDVLRAIEHEFDALAQAKSIALRVRPSVRWVCSDPLLVRRIVSNLVMNAVRYTDRGGVLVACRARGSNLRIEVRDTGCGIPADRREDVFHEFVQLGSTAEPSTTTFGRGLGLGLSIVARIAGLLGTRIELRSQVGCGSTFAFEVPLAAPSVARPAGSVVPLRVATLRGTLAAVVDDDEVARTAMSGLLETWGCTVLSATDAGSMLAQLRTRREPPDILLCDYRLAPGDDGADAIARIRAAVAVDVPAILVTADTTRAAHDAAHAAGAALLHKPVSPVKLRALLARLLPVARDADVGEAHS
jgi:signal transduction histidine kinase/ActR/RegA family two-component response regulator